MNLDYMFSQFWTLKQTHGIFKDQNFDTDATQYNGHHCYECVF